MFDLKMDFVGDFSLPPSRVVLKGLYAKKRFAARYYREKLRAVLLCQATPKKSKAKAELRAALGSNAEPYGCVVGTFRAGFRTEISFNPME